MVYACEPCDRVLNFEETVERTDLIIIGQRTDYTLNEEDLYETLPDTINVEIIQVLKGESKQREITVNSWDGMCGYGFVIDDKRYVMLLEEKDGIYDAVDFGCSVKTFSVDNDLVDFNGNKISIDEFTDKLNKWEGRQVIDDGFKKQIPVSFYILSLVVILSLLLLVVLISKKK